MTAQCEHDNPTATCCQCLTEKFRAFEESARQQREAAQLVRQSIRTYRSGTLGYVTIPE
jgi:hypothetical protein